MKDKEARRRILVVDDEKDTVEMITALLDLEGFEVLPALSGDEAMRILEVESQKISESETPVDLILLDILLGDVDGREICLKIKEDEKLKFIPVIILTVRSSLKDKIHSLNLGADDYLTKPFINEELLAKVKVMLRIKDLHDELRREKDKNILLTQALEKRYSFGNILGKNTRMQEVFELISDIADTDSTVLIQGESGTGKELIARAIHFNSYRKNKPFVVANCSAYSQNLLESELFGHEKGSFTGAIRRKIGRFELANGGTIFLDEIGEVSPPTQILLLRVLQDHRFERVGGEETLEVDVRVIAATNKNLTEEMKKGTFREDLYYRLNVIPIFVPPLRERKDDIPLLASYFLQKFSRERGKEVTGFSPEVIEILLAHSWPGNVRELENVIDHAIIISKQDKVLSKDLPQFFFQRPLPPQEFTTLQDYEKNLILKTLQDTNWNKHKTSKKLNINRSTLYGKIKRYGLEKRQN
ncbi:MAG: response regulator with CheY-like receiver, AAA-type ATPase, and DNA-binding domain [Deltaproteobacteria bacterium]|jgi:DNA-binding NtrC family response regulator|nr:response regulator with CheY-like receiver, AAA-type ATPase, and DNA-binding domain [Deltaproteobacteria bacterium]